MNSIPVTCLCEIFSGCLKTVHTTASLHLGVVSPPSYLKYSEVRLGNKVLKVIGGCTKTLELRLNPEEMLFRLSRNMKLSLSRSLA